MAKEESRLASIDGLRAIAVLAVILFHLHAPTLPGGFVGVDIFFAISGYVVCRSLLKGEYEGFRNYARSFYARRMLRLIPALVLMLGFVAFFSRVFIPVSGLAGQYLWTGYSSFFGLSNYQIVDTMGDYFGRTADFNPFIHTWSLAVEEQFYVLFPALIYFGYKAKASAYSVIGRFRGMLLPSLLGVSLAFSAFESSVHPEKAFFLLPSRFWELAAGAMLYIVSDKRNYRTLFKRFGRILSVAGLLAISIAFLLADQASFPLPWALLPVGGSLAVIAGVVESDGRTIVSRMLGSGILSYIGRISYSLYLWHWPVIVLLRWTIGVESVSMMAMALTLSFTAAVLSYHLIESLFQIPRHVVEGRFEIVASESNSAQTGRIRLVSVPFNSLIFLIGIIATLFSAIGYLKVISSPRLPQSVVMQGLLGESPWRLNAPDIVNGSLVAGPPGRPWSGRQIFVVGDSHAESYSEILSLLKAEMGVAVYLNSVGGSRVGSLMQSQGEADKLFERRIIEDLTRLSNPGDIVFLASMRVMRLADQSGLLDKADVLMRRDSTEAEEDRKEAVIEGRQLIARLEELGLAVMIDTPKPVFYTPPFRCSDWFNRMNPVGRLGFTISKDFLNEHQATALKSIAEIKSQFPKTIVWDPFAILCPEPVCSCFDGEFPLFIDGDHLSSYGNRKLYPDFLNTLRQVWKDNS